MTDQRDSSTSRRLFLRALGATSVIGWGVRSVETASAASGDEIWAFETNDWVEASPTVVDGTAYVGSADHALYAIDTASGTEEWSFQTGGDITAAAAVVNGTVYVGSVDTFLYAIDAESGTQEWTFRADASISSSPTVDNGTVYFVSSNIHAVDSSSGTQEWVFETGDFANSSPTIVDGTVYIGGSWDNNLYAIDAASGTEEWRFETSDHVDSAPTVDDGTVYVGSEDDNLYAIDAESGEEEWSFDTGDFESSSPTVIEGTVYVGSDGGDLYAVDADSGTEEWSFGTGRVTYSSPTVVEETVYIGSRQGTLYAVDAASGTENWTFQTGGDMWSSPTVVDGIVYIGSTDGNLYAVDADVAGSSEGSRVMLGTLGHHNNVAGQDSAGFNPTTHGFGFRNYDDGTPPDLGEISTIVSEEYLPRFESLGLPATVPGLATSIEMAVYSSLDAGLTNGHCLGMVDVAQQYYSSGLPELDAYSESTGRTIESAADIVDTPETDADLDPVEIDIDEVQHTQALRVDFGLRYLAEVFAPTDGPGSIDYEVFLQHVQQNITNNQSVSISLVDSSQGLSNRFFGGHQVLGYALSTDSESLSESLRATIEVYDPNDTAEFYADSTNQIVLSRFSTSEKFQIDYTGSDSDYNRAITFGSFSGGSLFVDGDSLAGEAAALRRGLGNFILVGVQSPITVDISTPNERQVSQVDAATETLQSETEYESVYVSYGVSSGDFQIQVEGTGSGEYTIDVKGTVSDGGHINESYTGSISEGETAGFIATIPNASDSSGTLSVGSNESVMDNIPSWLPVGGAAAGLGIGGYYYKRQQSDTQDDNE